MASSLEQGMHLALSLEVCYYLHPFNSNKSWICLAMPLRLFQTFFSLGLMEKPSGTFRLQNGSPRSPQGLTLDFPWEHSSSSFHQGPGTRRVLKVPWGRVVFPTQNRNERKDKKWGKYYYKWRESCSLLAGVFCESWLFSFEYRASLSWLSGINNTVRNPHSSLLLWSLWLLFYLFCFWEHLRNLLMRPDYRGLRVYNQHSG